MIKEQTRNKHVNRHVISLYLYVLLCVCGVCRPTWAVWIRAVLSSRRPRDAILTEHTHRDTLTESTPTDLITPRGRERQGGRRRGKRYWVRRRGRTEEELWNVKRREERRKDGRWGRRRGERGRMEWAIRNERVKWGERRGGKEEEGEDRKIDE